MTRSAKPLKIRQSNDGIWEVENVHENWVKCENEADTKIISNAPMVEAKLDKTMFPNETLATEFDKTAEIFAKCNIGTAARYFRSMAKKVRSNGVL